MPPEKPQTYLVNSNDTFESISEKLFGSNEFGSLIAETNGMSGADQLSVGLVLKIPKIEPVSDEMNCFMPKL